MQILYPQCGLHFSLIIVEELAVFREFRRKMLEKLTQEGCVALSSRLQYSLCYQMRNQHVCQQDNYNKGEGTTDGHCKKCNENQSEVCAPGSMVKAVATQMRDLKLGAILVVENDELKGIFTERDLLNRVVAEGRDPNSTPVMDVATSNPVVVRQNAHIRECAVILNQRGFRHLPVLGDDGKPVGIVSSKGFLQVYDRTARNSD